MALPHTSFPPPSAPPHHSKGKENWLFDMGEGSTRQAVMSKKSLMETTKIFITHMHGDHILGLPSLLLQVGTYFMIGKQHEGDVHPIHIYGPPGLHHFLCTVLRMTETMMERRTVVHELMLRKEDVARMGDACMWKRNFREYNHEGFHASTAASSNSNNSNSWFPSVIRKPIYSDANGLWNLLDPDGGEGNSAGGPSDAGVTVQAGLISHKVPCFGFVVKEGDISGRLLPEECDKRGVGLEDLRQLKAGHSVVTTGGQVVNHADVCGPSVPGRKVTVLGDTDDPSLLTTAAQNCDVLVHECSFDDHKRHNALRSGHSTPSMAISVARSFGAKRVILNHIGSQYLPMNTWQASGASGSGGGSAGNIGGAGAGGGLTGDEGTDHLLEEQAKEAFGLRGRHLHVARDFDTVRVPVGGYSALRAEDSGNVEQNGFLVESLGAARQEAWLRKQPHRKPTPKTAPKGGTSQSERGNKGTPPTMTPASDPKERVVKGDGSFMQVGPIIGKRQ